MNNTTNLIIEGMTCGHCVRSVTKALEAVPGVESARLDLAEKTAVVVHDETATVDALTAAIEDEGYSATGKR